MVRNYVPKRQQLKPAPVLDNAGEWMRYELANAKAAASYWVGRDDVDARYKVKGPGNGRPDSGPPARQPRTQA